MKPVMTISIQ